MNQQKSINLIFFFLSCCIVGCISICLGQDLNWDLKNYHYYIGWAFLNIPISHDFLGAGEQTYLNPFIDTVNYLLIKFLPPKLTGFLLGAIQGINFYLLGLLAFFTLSCQSRLNNWLLAILISFLGLMSAEVIAEIGTTFNDLSLASLILLSLFILQVSLQQNVTPKWKNLLFFISGSCIGIATGLKLTNSLYAIGGITACFWINEPFIKKLKLSCIFLLGIGTSFILTNGYWMIKLWYYFDNPIFPHYNAFFKSKYYLHKNFIDPRWFPKGILKKIFFPFFFSWQKHSEEINSRDFRLPIVYLLLVVTLVKNFYYRKIKLIKSRRFNSFERYLIFFFITSYISWQLQFSVLRYIIPLDILAPLLIYILLDKIFVKKIIVNIIFILLSILLLTTLKISSWGRGAWTPSFFDVSFSQPLNQERKTVVLITNPISVFIRPFLPNDWYAIGLFIYSENPSSTYLQSLISNLKQQGYYWYALTYQPNISDKKVLENYGFKFDQQCINITTKNDSSPHLLCPLRFIS